MTPRILVTRRIPDSAVRLLESAGEVWVCDQDRAMTPAELHEAVHGADAVVTMLHDRVDGEMLDAAGSSLRVVANVAVGYDNVDVTALDRRGVLLTNTPGVLTDATADLTFGLLLMTTRRLAEGERLIRSGTPWAWNFSFMLGSGLQGKTLGIVGMGQIGRAVARRALAFGMDVVYTARNRVEAEVENELGADFLPMSELLERSDVVSLHCPLTDSTRHLIDGTALSRMKSSAVLVNTSRGAVVDERALARALREETIAGAGLDVFENEPEVDPELLELDNAVMVPHLGSATSETRTAMAVLAARNVVGVLDGSGPVSPVNG
ncbi:D-isomer specific 2-hydroxyacid dehydrogenase, catalytic domain [Actinopolyspora xinjiangensis]|uniref:D-isomer specific 2-hydroxyacid dehydrogenase, catalytic domain n=1 Tax=Actinopolyspora xinjiangensis TaxID=405564 RepID=A0A1H0TSP2_9ACTN|nr:D-glycerate dehydrogenase [Actinopolyspora xinjiangensis]SDP57047.1 D-isomer specific 2-hydroxyacid dehydrogenase, catalytic domain [Actinopolyspora xinjiangensis]